MRRPSNHSHVSRLITLALVVSFGMTAGCKPPWEKSSRSRTRDAGSDERLNFGGACELKGPWVDAALQASNELRGAITKLKNAMDKCWGEPQNQGMLQNAMSRMVPGGGAGVPGAPGAPGGYGPRFQTASAWSSAVDNALNGLTKEVDPDTQTTSRAYQRLTSIPSELNATRKYFGAKGDVAQMATGFFNTLMSGKQIEAGLAATPAGMAAAGAAALTKRLQAGAASGMRNLNDLIGLLDAGVSSCPLDGGGSAALRATLIQSTRTLGAFLTGDDQLATGATGMIQKMLRLYEKAGMDSAVADLDRSEFMLSLSCLVESTSTAYCSMRDAQDLLNDMRNKYGNAAFAPEPDQPAPNPNPADGDGFEGYYILSKIMPTINKWVLDLQVGVEPMLKSDATYLNDLAGIQTAMIQQRMNLLGEFNDNARTIRSQTTEDAVAKGLYELVNRLGQSIQRADVAGQNFFAMALPEYYIPYYLTGLDINQVPAECRPGVGSAQQVSFQGWAQTRGPGGSYQEFFRNRDNALAIIQTQLRGIIDLGSAQASRYVQNRLKLDPALVVTSAINSVNPAQNIRLGMARIHRYLLRLSFRIAALEQSSDPADQAEARRAGSMTDAITETRERLKEIMKTIDEFANQGLSNNRAALANLSDQELRDAGLDPATVRATIGPVTSPLTPADQALESQIRQMEAPDARSRYEAMMEASRMVSNASAAFGIPNAPPNIAGELVRAVALGPVTKFQIASTAAPAKDPSVRPDTKARYLEVVSKIYNLLEVLILRESYLQGRMNEFVTWDMAQTVRRAPSILSTRGTDFIRAGEREMLSSYMMAMGNGQNPATMWNQFGPAFAIHNTNFSALSKVFQYHLRSFITDLNDLIVRPGQTELEKRDRAILRSMSDSWNYWGMTPEKRIQPGQSYTDWLGTTFARQDTTGALKDIVTGTWLSMNPQKTFITGYIRRSLYPELYPMPTWWSVQRTGNLASYKDDKYGSYARLLARLCVQSLAFADPELGSKGEVGKICRGKVLKSYWSDGRNNKDLNVYYDEIRAGMDTAWTRSDEGQYGIGNLRQADNAQVARKCAIYDSSRRNQIYWMNLDTMSDGQLSGAPGFKK